MIMESKETAQVLFMAYRHLVARVAVKYAPSPVLMDDVVHQVFVEFVSKAETWDLASDVRSLLIAMTKNIARRHWREAYRKQPDKIRELADHIRQILDEQEDDSHLEEYLHQMKICMESMPEKSKQLLEMHYFNGISVKEIAKDLRLNADSVYRAIYRIRQKLRRCIEFGLIKGERHG